MEKVSNSIIVCDSCSAEFLPDSLDFKTVSTVIEHTQFEVVFYTCPSCGKPYVVCVLNYWAKKLQDKYISALDGYRAAYKKHVSKVLLSQKLKKVEIAKEEAISYQNELLQKYGNLIPERILK